MCRRRGRRLLATSPTAGCTGSTRASRRRCRSRPRARGATPTSASIRAAAGSSRSARTTAPTASRSTRSSTSRSTASASRTCSSSGPDFLASPAPLARRHAARLAGVGSPGHALGRDPPANRPRSTEDGSLGPSDLAAGGPDESIVQPEWSPDGALHLVSDRTGWWNLYRLVGRARAWSRSPRWMPSSPTRPGSSTGRRYGFLPDGSIVAVARSGGRDRLIHVQPGGSSARSSIGRSPSSTACGSAPSGSSRSPARRPRPRWSSPSTPTTLAPSGILRRAMHDDARSGAISIPEPIDVPVDRRSHRPRAVLPAGERRPSRALTEERPPLVVRSHGGPTSNASTALDLDIAVPRPAGASRWSTSTTAAAPATAARTAGLSRAAGASSTSTTASPPPASSSSGATSTRSASRSRAAAPAATRRSRHWPSATSSRRASASTASATSRRWRRTRTSSRRATWTGSSGRTRRPPATYRERSPVHLLDEITCPVLVLQGLDDKVVPPSQAEAIVAALAANGIPHAYLALRGRGPRLPRRRGDQGLARGGARLPRSGLRLQAGRRHRAAGPARPRRVARAARSPRRAGHLTANRSTTHR